MAVKADPAVRTRKREKGEGQRWRGKWIEKRSWEGRTFGKEESSEEEEGELG